MTEKGKGWMFTEEAKNPFGSSAPQTDKQDEEKKPEQFKPNRAQRRLMRAQAIKLMSARRRMLPLVFKCGRCGLRFVAPTAQRCKCKIAKSRGTNANE